MGPDVGTVQGKFRKEIRAGARYSMDLNPDSRVFVDPCRILVEQDWPVPWGVDAKSVGTVSASDFVGHPADRWVLRPTSEQARVALRKGGRLIALGPNGRLVSAGYRNDRNHHPPHRADTVDLVGLTGIGVEYPKPATLSDSLSQNTRPASWAVRS